MIDEPARRPPDALAGVCRRRERLDRRGELRPEQDAGRVRRARRRRRSRCRCTRWPRSASSWRGRRPSDDGEELANLEAFQAVGPKVFDRVFPLRTPGQWGTVPKRARPVPVAARDDAQAGAARLQALVQVRHAACRCPTEEASGVAGSAALARFFPSLGGSKMWAMRKLGHAWLLTGPQLGFVMPERLVEIELHSPSLNVRGTTAAGAPVIGIGHNEHVAWGVTSGLGDEDDLYAEQLVGDEGYRFRGKTRDDGVPRRDVHLPAAAGRLPRAARPARLPDTSSGQPHRARLPDGPRAGPGGRRGRRASPTRASTRSGSARSGRSSASTRSTARRRSRTSTPPRTSSPGTRT